MLSTHRASSWQTRPPFRSRRRVALLNLCLLTLLLPSVACAWSALVVDAQTGTPLADAVVVRAWYRTIPTVAGGIDRYVTHREVATDQAGRFQLSKMLPSVSIPAVHEQPTLVYKPGYRAVWLRERTPRIALEPVPTDYDSRQKEFRRADPRHPLDLHRTELLAAVLAEEKEFLAAIRTLRRMPKRKRPTSTYRPPAQKNELPPHRPASREELEGWVRKIGETAHSHGVHRMLVAAGEDAVPYILPLTDHQREPVRRIAYAMLADIGGPLATDHLCTLAGSEKVFHEALRIGSSHGPVSSHPLRYSQAQEAINTLGKTHDRQAFHCLLQLYLAEPEKRNLTGPAIDQAGVFPAEELLKHLSHPDAGVRRDVYHWFGKSGDRRARSLLLQGLDDQELGVRRSCISGLIRLGEPTIWSYLIKQLEKEDYRTREAAVEFLVRHGEQSSQTVYESLKDGERKQRWQAVLILGQLEEDTTLKRLVTLSRDPAPEVRLMAVYGLGHYGAEETLPILAEVLESDPDSGIRTTAETVRDTVTQRIESNKPAKPSIYESYLPEPGKVVDLEQVTPGVMHEIKIGNRTMHYMSPPLSAQSIHESLLRERGIPIPSPENDSLYFQKLGFGSYEANTSCSDFNLPDATAHDFFKEAKEIPAPEELPPCYVYGFSRVKGVYGKWIIYADGTGHLIYDDGTEVYLSCKECREYSFLKPYLIQ